jgi:hypothetical protein
LIVSKIAGNVLEYCYKNQNNQKWNHIFENDKYFFRYLLKLSSELFQRTPAGNKKTCTYEIFESYKIFPWKNENQTNMPKLQCKLGSHKLVSLDNFVIPIQSSKTNCENEEEKKMLSR